jgi:hypothetical protein
MSKKVIKIIDTAAVLTIKNPAKMTVKGRKDIADWLRRHAHDLEMYGKDYAKLLRARYYY